MHSQLNKLSITKAMRFHTFRTTNKLAKIRGIYLAAVEHLHYLKVFNRLSYFVLVAFQHFFNNSNGKSIKDGLNDRDTITSI